jgi:aspartyl aminopeptidase
VLKLAPNSALRDRNGFNQLNVQTYGGGLWHTWFDRDLSLAGKVIVKSANNKVFSLYWHAKDEPMLKIPNLAIHLTDKSG